MWDLVGYPEDRFSHNEAHMITRFAVFFVDSRDGSEVKCCKTCFLHIQKTKGQISFNAQADQHLFKLPG